MTAVNDLEAPDEPDEPDDTVDTVEADLDDPVEDDTPTDESGDESDDQGDAADADDVDDEDQVDADVDDDADADDGHTEGDELGVEVVDVEVSEFEDHVDYEIADWSGQSRSLLDATLTAEGIAHLWQGTTLMVRVEDEAATDALIEVVNQTATHGLDPDRTRVVYEVGTWSAAMQTSLAEALGIGEIPFEWDENGDLVIYEDDEERVEEILDAMPDPDDPDAVDADGVDVQDVLSRLWQAVGDLAKRPTDSDAVLAAISCANEMEHIGLPFGFESSVWRDIVGKTLALRAALESEDEDDQLSDDDLIEGCEDLHRQLRAYI